MVDNLFDLFDLLHPSILWDLSNLLYPLDPSLLLFLSFLLDLSIQLIP